MGPAAAGGAQRSSRRSARDLGGGEGEVVEDALSFRATTRCAVVRGADGLGRTRAPGTRATPRPRRGSRPRSGRHRRRPRRSRGRRTRRCRRRAARIEDERRPAGEDGRGAPIVRLRATRSGRPGRTSRRRSSRRVRRGPEGEGGGGRGPQAEHARAAPRHPGRAYSEARPGEAAALGLLEKLEAERGGRNRAPALSARPKARLPRGRRAPRRAPRASPPRARARPRPREEEGAEARVRGSRPSGGRAASGGTSPRRRRGGEGGGGLFDGRGGWRRSNQPKRAGSRGRPEEDVEEGCGEVRPEELRRSNGRGRAPRGR